MVSSLNKDNGQNDTGILCLVKIMWPNHHLQGHLCDFLAYSREQSLDNITPNKPIISSLQVFERASRTLPDPSELFLLYFQWLERLFFPLLIISHQCNKKREQVSIFFFKVKKPLLILEKKMNSSATSQQCHCVQYLVSGGLLLAPKHDHSTASVFEISYESKIAPNHKGERAFFILKNFSPALPWPVYRLTQAPLHVLVMRGFMSYLENHF